MQRSHICCGRFSFGLTCGDWRKFEVMVRNQMRMFSVEIKNKFGKIEMR
jgi:hypothetical protein